MTGDYYDAVVIGAGLGGLAAASKLARSDMRVRVLERHNQPGGYASTFMRDGFEFDVSLHQLTGIGTPQNRGGLWNILEDLDITSRVNFLPISTLYRTIADPLDLRIPSGEEAALDVLSQVFPAERRGLARLFNRMRTIQHQAEQAANAGAAERSVLSMILRYPLLVHAATVPLSTVLDAELRDPLAKLAFAQIWCYLGLPPSRLSLIYFAFCLMSFLRYGGSYPEGKSQTLSNAFVEVIEAAGGEVSLGQGAQSIICQQGRVRGVISDAEEWLQTDTVVANANPLVTALELIDQRECPPEFLQRLASASTSLSSFCVHLGLNNDHHALGLEDHEVFINATADLDEQYAACFCLEPPTSLLMTAYNVHHPNYSPPGTSVVGLTALADGATWAAVDPHRYPELKLRLAEGMVQQATRHYPKLAESIETCVVSTPITNMRYTGNVDGAIYGLANTPAQNPAFRLEQRGPIEGLWFAGAWTQPGGGHQPCIESGYTAAKIILAERQARTTAFVLSARGDNPCDSAPTAA